VADAHSLPFEDALFDAVISESVLSLNEDKRTPLAEYVRVMKPGGYLGLNESVWRKVPPPRDVVAWAKQDVGGDVSPLTVADWQHLLKDAGLSEVAARAYDVTAAREAKAIIRRYGWGGVLRVLARTAALYARSPDYRRFVKGVRRSGVLPPNLPEYFGYGLFVGRK